MARKIITPLTVDRVLLLCQKSGMRFGTVLENIGLVTGDELAQALALQFGLQVVTDFAKFKFPENVLAMVPVETAMEQGVFPLKLQNGVLALATIDPSNEKVMNAIGQSNKVVIHPVIATRKDIHAAIAIHYLKRAVSERSATTVLIADDDKLVVNRLTTLLQQEGYEAIVASDGIEAFKEIVCRKPHLILTDKEMPKFNGYLLLSSLKNIPETRNIPVILMTASTNPDEEAIAYEKGFFDFISKPFRPNILSAKVRRALTSNRNAFTQFHY